MQGVQIPRKPKHACSEYMEVEKHCDFCKKHGGAHTTHNTSECRRYKKDGTPTRGTITRQGKGSGNNQNSKKSYAQVVARMEKLEKSLKKVNKKCKKRCHHKESDSSNSNYSWSLGYSSTNKNSNCCKKLKLTSESKKYTTTGPIKTTNSLNSKIKFRFRNKQ